MRVFAVVLNWNGGDENLACVRSLLEQGLPPERIVFVDNASTDGSTERVEREVPGVRVLRNPQNLGYGYGNDVGIEAALAEGAEAVWVVNNDVVFEPEALARLVGALERRSAAGVVGPRVLYKRDPSTVWSAGGRLTFHQNLTTMIGHGRPDGERYRRTCAVDYVTGSAMLVRREVFERIGLIDGDYFAYHEDVDFCLKAKRAGFEVLCVGEAAARHAASHSTGGGYTARRKYMQAVNTVRFLRVHGTPARWLSFFAYDVLSLPPLFLVGLVRGRWKAVLAKAKGLLDGARGKQVTAESIEPGSSWLW